MNNPKKPFRLLIKLLLLASVFGCAGDELTTEEAKMWSASYKRITGSKTFESINTRFADLPNGDPSPDCYWVDSKDADTESYNAKNKIDHPRDSKTGFSQCTWVPNTSTTPSGSITIIFAKQSDQFIWAKKRIGGALFQVNNPDAKIQFYKVEENSAFE